MTPAGRPLSDNPKAIKYSIRIDSQTEQKLKTYCDKHNISKGEAIRRAIAILLDNE